MENKSKCGKCKSCDWMKDGICCQCGESVPSPQENKENDLEQLLYQFADNSTDGDGEVDKVGSHGFTINSKPIKDFIKQRESLSFEEGRNQVIKEIEKYNRKMLNQDVIDALDDVRSLLKNK